MNKTDEQRLTALYLSVYPILYKKTFAVYRNPQFVEDVIHEAFAIACENPQRILNHACPEGWLIVTVRHVAERRSRLRENHQILTDSIDMIKSQRIVDPAELADPDILYEDLAKTEEYRIIRMLIDTHITLAEASKQAGVSEGAYKMRISRAKKKLRDKFRKLEK